MTKRKSKVNIPIKEYTIGVEDSDWIKKIGKYKKEELEIHKNLKKKKK